MYTEVHCSPITHKHTYPASVHINNKVEEGNQRRVTVEEGKWDLGGGGGSLLQREQKLEAVCVCGIELQVPLGNIAYITPCTIDPHPAAAANTPREECPHPGTQDRSTTSLLGYWTESRKANANYGWNLAGSCVFTSTQLITRAPN